MTGLELRLWGCKYTKTSVKANTTSDDKKQHPVLN